MKDQLPMVASRAGVPSGGHDNADDYENNYELVNHCLVKFMDRGAWQAKANGSKRVRHD